MNNLKVSRRKLLQAATTLVVGSVVSPSLLAQKTINLNQDDFKTIYIPPGGGIKGKISRSEITFKLDKEQTDGHFGSSEMIIPPGQLGAPPHYHQTFDEICIVLEGAVHIMVEDEVTEVKKGGWHLRPRGKVHTFWNSGKKKAKVIELCAPGGHEAYMLELSKLFQNGAKPSQEDLGKLAGKYDIVFQFERLDEIMHKYNVAL